MAGKGNRLYFLLLAGCAAGYTWITLNLLKPQTLNDSGGVCFVKHLSGLPCPSCGVTRAILWLIDGDIAGSLHTNPLGLVLALVLIAAPLWLLVDKFSGKKNLLRAYQTMEAHLRRPWLAIPLIVLVLANWIWNIAKGL